jgi:hypothetical protein
MYPNFIQIRLHISGAKLENILLEYCWFLVHGQVLLVIWFVTFISIFFVLGTANADRFPWVSKLYGSGS